MTEATKLGRIGLAGLIVVAAIGTAWLMVPDAFPRFGSRPGTEGPPMAAAPGTLPPAALPAPADPALVIPEPEAPRFHVARVGARGMLVTAGIAAPGAEVRLLEAGRELGRARADVRGEWVILPGDPLPPGPKELSLLARSPGGEPIASRDSLLLVVPEPQVAQAMPTARPDAAGAMAMLLPPTTAAGAA